MKNLLQATAFLFCAMLSISAQAAFTPDQLLEATKASLDQMKKTSAAHFPHVTGYKAWNSDDEAKVVIYVDHDGMPMEFEYICQNTTPVVCVASP